MTLSLFFKYFLLLILKAIGVSELKNGGGARIVPKKGLKVFGLILVMLIIFAPPFSAAETKNWIGLSGNWTLGDYWSPAGMPQDGDDVMLVSSDAISRFVAYDNTIYPEAHHGILRIDATGSGRMVLVLGYVYPSPPNYPLYADNAAVGWQGAGEINHWNGEANFGSLSLGEYSGSRGYYLLDSGSLQGNIEAIGIRGTGIFDQRGGSNSYGWLILGYSAGSSGSYTLSEGSLSGSAVLGGINGTGDFVQKGGNHAITGYLSVGNGTYELQDGELQARDEWIGSVGRGEFNQSGGSNTVVRDLTIGRSDGVGTYSLSGGGLLSENLTVGDDDGGQGLFRQTEGTNTVNQTVSVGKNPGSLGVYRLSDGILSAENLHVGDRGQGSFVQRGGTVSLTNELIVGHERDGRGTFQMSGGNLWSDSTKVADKGEGAFTQSGGRHAITHTLTVGVSNPGSYALSGDATLEAETEYIGYAAAGTFTQSGGANRVTTDLWVGGPQLLPFLAPGKGSYSLEEGTVSARDVIVGRDGEGDFSQGGGEASLSGTLYLGRESGGEGTYDFGGGSLKADYMRIGNAGTGNFIHTGGQNSLTHTMFLGFEAGSQGSYTLNSSGVLAAASEVIGRRGRGDFSQRGGTNVIDNALVLGGDDGGRGVYRLRNGSLRAGQEIIGLNSSGTFIQTGGANQVGTLRIAENPMSAGEYRLDDGLLISGSLEVGRTGIFSQRGGTFNTGPLSNAGEVNLQGGTVEVTGDITNQTTGRLNISHDVSFPGNTTNDGTIKTTGATVTWGGTFTNHGAYISDPSRQTFNNLVVGPEGFLVGGQGDAWLISNDFLNHSTMAKSWNTSASWLCFVEGEDTIHQFFSPALDLGNDPKAFRDNFAWGGLDLTDQTLWLLPDQTQGKTNDPMTFALYIMGEITGLEIQGDQVVNIAGHGNTIYYNPLINEYLHGKTYALLDGGSLCPAPLPATWVLLGSVLLGLLGLRHGRRRGDGLFFIGR